MRREVLISEDPGDDQQGERHDCRPVRPSPLLQLDRSDRLKDVRRADRLRRAHRAVIFVNQRLGVYPHGARDAADMPASVEVATTAGEVVAFNSADDGFPDAGALTDLRNRQACLAASLCQCVTDAHAVLLPRSPSQGLITQCRHPVTKRRLLARCPTRMPMTRCDYAIPPRHAPR